MRHDFYKNIKALLNCKKKNSRRYFTTMDSVLSDGVFQISQRPENFEDILEKLGGFGRFQILILILILIFEIPTAFLIFIHTFTGRIPPEWNCDDDLIHDIGAEACNGSLSEPFDSFVAEFELIGSAGWVPDFITTVQMTGMIIGNVLSCLAADWYGRRYTTIVTHVLLAVASAASALSPNLYFYIITRFICGCAFASHLSLGAVYAMEFMTTRWRMLGCSCGPLGIGSMTLAVLAYWVRPWRTLRWITACSFCFILVCFPFMPESPRWLLQQGKTQELLKVLDYIGRVNGKSPIAMSSIQRIVARECPPKIVSESVTPKNEARLTYLVFFKGGKDLRRKSICMLAIFFAWSVIFFGLNFNIKNMEGNLYWNVFYFGLSEAPMLIHNQFKMWKWQNFKNPGFIFQIGLPSAMLFLNSVGRRISVIFSMFLSSFFLVILAILQLVTEVSLYPTLVLILALLAKFAISFARSATKALSNESFPTKIRSMGAGMCGVSTAIGGIVCSQLAYIGTANPAIPFFAFAIIGVTGSLFALLIPETGGQPLQESMPKKRGHFSRIVDSLTVVRGSFGAKGRCKISKTKDKSVQNVQTLSSTEVENGIPLNKIYE